MYTPESPAANTWEQWRAKHPPSAGYAMWHWPAQPSGGSTQRVNGKPGTIVPPPSAPSNTEKAAVSESHTLVDDESDDESVDGDTELPEKLEFHPEYCLFCSVESSSFDDNLAHMTKAHSFTIPYQDQLTVEPETLVEYLHLVICGYGECIMCAARRRTVEGIQHHMTAKGHCRFNVAADIAEFYDEISAPEYQADEESLRLPSGKLLNHRTRTTGPAAARTARQFVERRSRSAALQPSATASKSSELIQAQDKNSSEASSSQLSRLTRGDQRSLAHLADHEVRSLLASGARAIDHSMREEKQAKLRLEQASNITMTAHFRMDTSKRFRGLWG
ncbi:Zinc finger protein [Paramyrothecium foliicola]|nr:Zinc finger protein [Paramyrothecium foliicola]